MIEPTVGHMLRLKQLAETKWSASTVVESRLIRSAAGEHDGAALRYIMVSNATAMRCAFGVHHVAEEWCDKSAEEEYRLCYYPNASPPFMLLPSNGVESI